MQVKEKYQSIKKILISRTDAIGDVILTLPMTGFLKRHWPKAEIHFLGQSYTEEIVKLSSHVTKFIDKNNLDQVEDNYNLIIHVFPQKYLAKFLKNKGTYRLGTKRRIFHWMTCNIRPIISRKNSQLHEAELNLSLLSPLFNNFSLPKFDQLLDLISVKKPEYEKSLSRFLEQDKKNILIHPKSRGSAIEWGEENFMNLLELSKDSSKINFILTGTKEEEDLIHESLIQKIPHIKNSMGQLSLTEFISLVYHSDGIVAGSTGPLHISSLFNHHCFALFPEWPSIGPNRWRPLSCNTHLFVDNKIQSREEKILKISAQDVFSKINQVFNL